MVSIGGREMTFWNIGTLKSLYHFRYEFGTKYLTKILSKFYSKTILSIYFFWGIELWDRSVHRTTNSYLKLSWRIEFNVGWLFWIMFLLQVNIGFIQLKKGRLEYGGMGSIKVVFISRRILIELKIWRSCSFKELIFLLLLIRVGKLEFGIFWSFWKELMPSVKIMIFQGWNLCQVWRLIKEFCVWKYRVESYE